MALSHAHMVVEVLEKTKRGICRAWAYSVWCDAQSSGRPEVHQYVDL